MQCDRLMLMVGLSFLTLSRWLTTDSRRFMIIPMLCVTIFVILVVWFLLPRVARLMFHTPTAISIFVCLSMVQLMAVFISMQSTLCGHFLQVALTLILVVEYAIAASYIACKIRGLMVTVCPSQFATRRTLFHVLVGCGLLMLKVSRLKLPVIWLLVSMWLNTFTKSQAGGTSQDAVQKQNEPQLRDENAHNDKSGHGVLKPTYQAGLRRDAVQPDIEAERKKRDEIEAGKSYCSRRFGGATCDDKSAQIYARFDKNDWRIQPAEFYRFHDAEVNTFGYF